MSVGTEFYQRLSVALKPETIPGNLAILEDGAEALIAKLFFSDAVMQKSSSGDSGYTYLRIITGQEIGFGIGGAAGIRLIINPNPSGAGTEFPVSFRYQWKILEYKRDFSHASFGDTISGIFNVFKDVAQITDEEFLIGVLSTFIEGDDSIASFTSLFNVYNSGAYQLNPTIGFTPLESVREILERLDQQDIDLFKVVFDLFLGGEPSVDEFWKKLKRLFNRWLNHVDPDTLLDIIVPKFNLKLESLSAAIEFPESIFTPVDPGIPKSLLTFNIGSLIIDSKTGFDFQSIGSLSFPESEIANSGFTIGFTEAKLDLSTTTNIAEADADNRPRDFVGIYIQDGSIGFPAFWNHDNSNSTGQITARNLLVGTGGISGTLGLEAKTAGNPAPLIKAKFGSGFEVSLDAFEITFQQNAIISSGIHGTMKIPNFKDALGNPAEIGIDIHIGQDGDFKVTASEPDGIELCIPNVLKFILKSASVGRKDDRFFLSISGSLSFNEGTSIAAQILPTAIEFQEVIIWDDGQFEIKGGGLELPQALSLEYPPVNLSITAIHLGSVEREYNNGGTPVMRKYKYFGLDGKVKVDPGGVEARGKGIQVYFSSDNSVLPLDMFIRIESIAIDLIIPGDVHPNDATLLIKGFLSMKEPPPGIEGTEYSGGITFDLPKAGIGGAAAMKYNPNVPYFIIDAEVELAKAIPLGSTGLGLYGFRGLIGKHYVVSKSAAGVADAEPWWKYYKAKVDPDYKEGVQISKFSPTGGFALGLGVSLATTTDGGKVFSSKIFLLLSLRELIMLQGQAAVLKDRVKLSDPNDPPFFALLVITKQSIEAALGVNYLVPDDKRPGAIATVQGVLELGFFFKDSSAWYLNIGRDLPESYRISVRLLELFDAYFYFMLSGKGIRAGAGASFDWDKKFGPLRAHLYAYLDVAGKVAFKPKQVGGSIQLGGGIELSIFGLGFGVSAAASLAAESPEPFTVTGGVKACVRVLKKDRCAKFEFEWTKNTTIDTTEISVIPKSDLGGSSQAINIHTKETFRLNFVKASSGMVYRGFTNPDPWLPPSPTSPHWNGSFDDHIIPLDCFIDIDFKNGMNPYGNASTEKFGKSGGAEFIQFVPPQKGKTPRVQHNFVVEDIFIYAWNPNANAWQEYDIYDALTPMYDLPFIDPMVVGGLNLKFGYWQLEAKNKFNKLRILAQTPFSYVTETTGEYIPENSGVTASTVFCVEEPKTKTCVNFEDYPKVSGLPVGIVSYINWNTMYFYDQFSFKIKCKNANTAIMQTPTVHLGHNFALKIDQGHCLEIIFNEPMASVDFTMSTAAQSVLVEYYQFIVSPTVADPLNVIEFKLPFSNTFTAAQLNSVQNYTDPNNLIDKIVITPGICPQSIPVTFETCNPQVSAAGIQLGVFLDTLVKNAHHTLANFRIYPDQQVKYDGAFLNTVLYNRVNIPGDNVRYTKLAQTNVQLRFRVTDNYGFNCQYTLTSTGTINWVQVLSLTNLRPNPALIGAGNNFAFLIDAKMVGGTTRVLSGTSTCTVIFTCIPNCPTFLYKLCTLSGEDYFYNSTIPGSSYVNAEVDTLVNGLEKTFQPIWRPNTKYAIAIKTNEAVSGGGLNNHRNTFYYGFQTKGPLGHFHNYLDDSDNEVIREDYQQLLDTDQEDSYQLSKLKHYIDFRRSYPNADGDLLNAKPLLYSDPKLLLFFKKQYVYSMFGNWDTNLGSGPVNGSLSVVIEDAIVPQVEPIPTLGWALDALSIKGKDVQILNNMIANSSAEDCPPDDPINQNGVNAVIEIEGLEPLKLYTAVFSNSYQRNTDLPSATTIREVHRYPFRTSRYGTFEEQVLSYQLLKDPIDPMIILKSAIFNVERAIISPNILQAATIIGGIPVLIIEYANYFERILQGALKLGTLQPAISTEFNIVEDTNTNNILGIWIRCPEPFNDPKLPESEMATTVQLSVNSGSPSNYVSIFSKDGREVFVTQTDGSLHMPTGSYAFTFDYREWDGAAYISASTVEVIINI